jgi:regulation of enolase protein 1 (concanavalin A-like superfamily)
MQSDELRNDGLPAHLERCRDATRAIQCAVEYVDALVYVSIIVNASFCDVPHLMRGTSHAVSSTRVTRCQAHEK